MGFSMGFHRVSRGDPPPLNKESADRFFLFEVALKATHGGKYLNIFRLTKMWIKRMRTPSDICIYKQQRELDFGKTLSHVSIYPWGGYCSKLHPFPPISLLLRPSDMTKESMYDKKSLEGFIKQGSNQDPTDITKSSLFVCLGWWVIFKKIRRCQE